MNPHHKTDRKLVLLMASVLLLSAFSLKMTARNTIIGGIKMGDFQLAGVSYAQADVLLAGQVKSLVDETVQFEYDGVLQNIALRDLGFEIDEKATMAMLKDVSYGDGILDNLGGRLVGAFGDVELYPVLKLDRRMMAAKLQTLYPNLAAPKNAELVVNGQDVSVVEQKDGVRIDLLKIEANVLASLEKFELPGRISIEAVPTNPTYLNEAAYRDAEILKGILGRKITLRFTEYENMTKERTAILSGEWVRVKNSEFVFNEDFIANFLRTEMQPEINRPVQHAVIKKLLPEGQAYGHVEVEGTARDGLTLDIDKSVKMVTSAIANNVDEIELVVDREAGLVTNEASDDEFVMISEGVSGYWGSGWGRRFNINKGLSETLENVVVAPGAEFSFNENLGPVDRSGGWQDALAIFGGSELIPVPGGGLCQVSTTLYRAVLAADLEILEQSGHTLYITYYEEFGNGLDAAIYPGSKDFRFRNTTDGPILLQGYSEGDYGYLKIYGQAPEKKVKLIGPIYSGRIPEKYMDIVDFVNWNEIAWIQEVTDKDGKIEENLVLSRYRTAPRKLYGYTGD